MLILRKKPQFLLVLIGMFCLVVGNAVAAKRVALVIGIDKYLHLPVLQKAVNDASSITEALTKTGFEVINVENPTRRQLNRSISDLEFMISPGDQVFFFFAGHGVPAGHINYLLPADMPLPDPGDGSFVRREAFALDQIIKRIQSRGATVTFVVLDACRNNPFQSNGIRSMEISRGLRNINVPEGAFVLLSAGIGQTALVRLNDSDSDPHSLFVRNLVPLLQQSELNHVQLAIRIQVDVDKLAAKVGHKQRPAYFDQLLDKFYFVKK